MSRHDPWVRVLHMRDHAALALEAAQSHTRQEIEDDYVLRFALVHLVELVGEAAAHVDQAIRDMAPRIPWSEIVNTRNRMIHGYEYLDYDVLWDIVNNDLPILLEEVKRLLANR